MVLKDLRSALLARLDQALQPMGFRKRQQSFYLDAGSCRRLFHIAFINHTADFDVTADVAVRHHAIEDLLNQNRPWLSEREKKETATVGAELGNIVGVGQHRWRVAEADDIGFVTEDILDWFHRVGEPFFERFSSLEEVQRVLEADETEGRLVCPFPQQREETAAAIRRIQEDVVKHTVRNGEL